MRERDNVSIVHVAFYPSDWLAGTRGLSAEESGVYITLVCRMYEMAGPIERDDDRLSRLCGCKSKAAFVRALGYLIAEGKVIEVEGGLFNERVEKELQNTTEKSTKARQAAQSRWDRKARKIKGNSNADASPKHMPGRCQSESESDKKERDTDVSLVLSAPEPASPLAEAVTLFNEAATEAGWSKVQKMTPARSQALRARLRECDGIEGWRIAMDKAKASDFLCGRTAKPWTGCGFDWLTKQANFTKLMEGNYDNREGTGNGKPTGADIARQVAEQYTRGIDSREGSDASQPLLPARQPAGRDRGGSW